MEDNEEGKKINLVREVLENKLAGVVIWRLKYLCEQELVDNPGKVSFEHHS